MPVQAIRDSLPAITADLVNGAPVAVNKTGHWYREGAMMATARWITGQSTARDARVVQSIQTVLDDIEKTPFEYALGDATLGGGDAHMAWMAGMAAVQRYNGTDDQQLDRAVNTLARRVLALEYRMLGAEETPNLRPLADLITRAQKWMDGQIVYDHANLDDRQIEQLRQACRYPHFVDLIQRDSHTRSVFFKWALRDGLNVDIFVQFPATQKRLSSAYLDKRIGRLSKELLTMTKTGVKDVTLPFEGKPVSILDEKHVVTFANDYQMTIKGAFNVFRNKNKDVGNLEWVGDGLRNWNVFKLGPWNPRTEHYDSIDPTAKEWWKQLPAFEGITADEVAERYGRRLADGEYGLAAKASRTTPDLNSLDSHGWLEILIPDGNGMYDILPIGKYATHYPATWQEYVGIACATEPAGLQYPEENVFRTSRQHAALLHGLDQGQFDLLMNVIGDDLRRVQEGGLVFQALGNNCASWVQQVFDRVIGEDAPRLYDLVYYNAEMNGPAAMVFGPFQAIPHHGIKDYLLRKLFKVLGADNGIETNQNGQTVYRSLTNSKFWESGIHHHPPLFVQRVIDGHFEQA